jgi:hypothetical protein
MPRLSQNPELKRAARLARVGPDTWKSWVDAGRVPLEMIKSFMGDSVGGDLLRAAGVEMPPKRGDLETLKENIVDFGMPNLPVGQIKRLSHAIRKGSPEGKKLREVMSKEMGLRGKADQDDYVDSLLRSTPFHGRGYEHYPQTGELYNTGFGKPGNIGEPQGLSLTYREPRKFVREHSSFAKRPKKYLNAAARLNRAMDKAPDTEVKELDALLSKLVRERSSLKNTMTPGAEGAFKPELVDELNKADAKIDNLIDIRDTVAKNSLVAKIGRKQAQYFDKGKTDPAPISRVFPRFHGRPSEKIVKGWSGSGDEGVLQEAYTYALKQMPEIWSKTVYSDDLVRNAFPDLYNPSQLAIYEHMAEVMSKDPEKLRTAELIVESFNRGEVPSNSLRRSFGLFTNNFYQATLATAEDASKHSVGLIDNVSTLINIVKDAENSSLTQALLPSYQGIKASMNGRAKQEFNTHLSDYLRSKGYRGILYSPQRYGEYEMRMLDPRDVVQQDIRNVDDPALERLYKGKAKKSDHYKTTIKRVQELREEAAGLPNGDPLKASLMSEASELHRRLDIRENITPGRKTTSKKTDTIKEWQARSDYEANPYQESGHSPYALGSIYSDIDMSALRLDPDEVRQAAREQVKMGVLAQEEQTLADGLSLGKLGDSRVRQDDVPIFTQNNKYQAEVPPHELQELGDLGKYPEDVGISDNLIDDLVDMFGVSENDLMIHDKLTDSLALALKDKALAGNHAAGDFLHDLLVYGDTPFADDTFEEATKYLAKPSLGVKVPKSEQQALEDLKDFTVLFGSSDDAVVHMKKTGKPLPESVSKDHFDNLNHPDTDPAEYFNGKVAEKTLKFKTKPKKKIKLPPGYGDAFTEAEY